MRRLLVLISIAAGVVAAANLDGLDPFVEESMRAWKVPGVAIAVLQDGRIILSKGYGQRDVKNAKPVTPGTLFAIGSASKSFTVTVLGTLVDAGQLEWDKPVRTYLPDFRMFDETTTERMTPRDLVTHRSGLPRHDLMWYSAPFTRPQL
jgi:CubicO group peptidase (beta-lactamase class C family)